MTANATYNYFRCKPHWDDVLAMTYTEPIAEKYSSIIDYANIKHGVEIVPGITGTYTYTTDSVISDIMSKIRNIKIEDFIKEVIFNDPATIIIWKDGTKTVVKAQNEPFDKEKGFAIAILKHLYGDKGNFNNLFRKFVENNENKSSIDKSVKIKRNVRLQEKK